MSARARLVHTLYFVANRQFSVHQSSHFLKSYFQVSKKSEKSVTRSKGCPLLQVIKAKGLQGQNLEKKIFTPPPKKKEKKREKQGAFHSRNSWDVKRM